MPEPFLVHEAPTQGPATHALVVGVGAYPHLNGGGGRLSEQHDGMAQLTSPPLSAREFASWLLSEFKHPHKPLGSVALLLSESAPTPFVAANASVNPFSAPVADSANVRRAIERLFRLGNENSGNLLIFYFCGHGIAAGTDTALLLADYGANDLHALEGAIDFRRLRIGMGRSKASEQCYFIDACRASTDTLIEAVGHAGQVIFDGGVRASRLPPRRAPVFYATMNGFKAYARPGQPTIFTNALLQALRDLAADDEEGDWRVSTNRIQAAVEHVSEREASDVGKQQVPTADDVANIHLSYLDETPEALVYVKSQPADAIEQASLAYKLAGNGVWLPAPAQQRKGQEWHLRLPAGSYDFTLTVAAKPPCIVPNSVRPAFRVVTMKVPP